MKNKNNFKYVVVGELIKICKKKMLLKALDVAFKAIIYTHYAAREVEDNKISPTAFLMQGITYLSYMIHSSYIHPLSLSVFQILPADI